MYQIHYLNKISPKGTALWREDYQLTEHLPEADGVLVRSEVAAHFLQRRDQARAGAGVVEAHKLLFFKGDVHIKAPFPRSFSALFCVDVPEQAGS